MFLQRIKPTSLCKWEVSFMPMVSDDLPQDDKNTHFVSFGQTFIISLRNYQIIYSKGQTHGAVEIPSFLSSTNAVTEQKQCSWHFKDTFVNSGQSLLIFVFHPRSYITTCYSYFWIRMQVNEMKNCPLQRRSSLFTHRSPRGLPIAKINAWFTSFSEIPHKFILCNE